MAAWNDIELVTFDLDDTLVATTATIPARTAPAVARWGDLSGHIVTADEVSRVTYAVLTCDPDLRWEALLDAIGISRGHRHGDEVVEAYMEPLLDLLGPTSGACETVARLGERFALAVITNGSDELRRAKLRRSGLEQLEPPAIVSGAFGAAKPHASIFHHACERAGVSPCETVHVGDSPVNDVEGAIRAGLRAVLLRTGVPHPQSTVKPDATIDTLTELLTMFGLAAVRA